jgi:hypothetical protein
MNKYRLSDHYSSFFHFLGVPSFVKFRLIAYPEVNLIFSIREGEIEGLEKVIL